MGGHPLRSPTRRCLGRPLPYQLADGPQAPPEVIGKPTFRPRLLNPGTTCGISSPFELLFPASGQVTYVLRTHSPLNPRIATRISFDLHVLSTPPAFILSQDQTLRMTFNQSPRRETSICFGDLLSTRRYTTHGSGRPSHRNETVTPSCLPWCFFLPLFSC